MGQYLPGYTVTAAGALLGLFYGFVSGFFLGLLLAWSRNFFVRLYVRRIRTRAELESLADFLDHV